ncbi:hypothetical protein F5Y10DRAFT_253143 [Nemania abortiva]|nr:hypothetical protein F5Y10DRAFT_253143 [Nemania abortiva]
MDKIPPEIVYVICSLLEIDDILNFRLVNKLFADIGAVYMLPDVTFYMHQEELDRLEAISLHPIFSRHVVSLTYHAEILVSPKVTWFEFLRNHKRNIRWNGTLRETPQRLVAEYHNYSDAVDEQDELIKKKKDALLLKEVLPRFPKLETLRMSSGHWLYGEPCRVRRKNPFAEFFKRSHMGDIYPEGKRPLDALLVANAHSPCALTTLRAGPLHWGFFKRSEQELTTMFGPLANLTSIGFAISVTSSDESMHESSSLRKCRRVLAKGNMRKILQSLPRLQCLHVEIEDLEPEEEGKGAWLRDVIEPSFRWANLKQLTLGGIATNRTELMSVLKLHKGTLRILCLRDVALASTSWRKLLPDIRKYLDLEEACICGDICGECEDDDDVQDPWSHPIEHWDLSVPELESDIISREDVRFRPQKRQRQSINMYCRLGGAKYPDELPLSEDVIDKYYDQYVKPFFGHDVDSNGHNNNDDLELSLSEEGNEGSWEDVSDEDFDENLSDGSIDSLVRDDAILLFHTIMADALGPLAGISPYDNEDEDADTDGNAEAEVVADAMDNILDFGIETIDGYGDHNLSTGFLSSILGPNVFGFVEQSDIESDDEMPELVSQ